MANTTFNKEYFSAVALKALAPVLAPLTAFSRDFSYDPAEKGTVINVPLVGSIGAPVEITTDNDAGQRDTSITLCPATLKHYQVSIAITREEAEGNKINNFETHIQALSASVGKKIQALALAPVTAANFGAAVIAKDATAWTVADLKTVWLESANRGITAPKMIVNPTLYSSLLPSNVYSLGQSALEQGKLPNINGIDIVWTNEFPANGEELNGIVTNGDGIVLASRLPVLPEGVALTEFIAQVNGVAVRFYTWYDLKARTHKMYAEFMLGVGKGNAAALYRLTEAA